MSKQGMCGAMGPDLRANGHGRIVCQLDWGHGGWHECNDYEAMTPGVLAVAPLVKWNR